MNNKLVIISIISLCLLVIYGFSTLQNEKYYYAYNEKIYLSEMDNKLIVRYKHTKKSDIKKLSLYSALSKHYIEWHDDSTCVIVLKQPSEKKQLKTEISKQKDVKSCHPVYAINTGLEMGVTDEILVGFYDNVPQSEIKKIHKKYNVSVVKTTEWYQ